jgi:hypothetical protein
VPAQLVTGGRRPTLDSVPSTSSMRSAQTSARGNHHEHEGRHHDRHEDLHEVAEERGERADLHVPAVDPVPAEPQHRDAGQVHDQHHGREHQRHELAGPQRDVGEIVVCAV